MANRFKYKILLPNGNAPGVRGFDYKTLLSGEWESWTMAPQCRGCDGV